MRLPETGRERLDAVRMLVQQKAEIGRWSMRRRDREEHRARLPRRAGELVSEVACSRVAETWGIAEALAPAQIAPLFGELAPKLIGHLRGAGAEPGMLVGYYDDPEE